MARLRRDTNPAPVAPPLRIFATGTVFLTHSLLVPSHPLPGTVSRAQSILTTRGGAAQHVLALLAQLAAAAPTAGDVEPMLIASLGGTTDALRLRDTLETAGVRTKYCKIWPNLGVPSAWVVHARDTDARTVVNHNPLPEVSHEDFIAILGPVLAPENYVGFLGPQPSPSTPIPRDQQSPSPVPVFPNALAPPSAPRPSTSNRPPSSPGGAPPPPHSYSIPSPSLHSPAPFDWLHVEGRSVRNTLANIIGVDGLARERKWRSRCVVSVDLGRRARDGVHALIPHADVIFLASTTFASLSQPGQPASMVSIAPGTSPTSRAILLSLARHAPPHALLVLNAGRDGAALLSLPTSEYLQSSAWSPPPNNHRSMQRLGGHAHCDSALSHDTQSTRAWDGVESVRSGSDFWAARGTGSGGGSGGEGGTANVSFVTQDSRAEARPRPSGESFHPMDDDDEEEEEDAVVRGKNGHGTEAVHTNGHSHGHVDPDPDPDADGDGDEDGRQTPQPQRMRKPETEEVVVLDEEGAHAAFVAGMIWALSRRVLPGPPYVPGLGANSEGKSKEGSVVDLGIRWRLDECLRFATELAGRKAYVKADDISTASVASSGNERGEWDGLGDAMKRAGWFD